MFTFVVILMISGNEKSLHNHKRSIPIYRYHLSFLIISPLAANKREKDGLKSLSLCIIIFNYNMKEIECILRSAQTFKISYVCGS